MDYYKESLKMHEEHKGKMAVASKVKVETKDDLSTAYTPGVAEPCRKIKEDPENVYKYTNKSNIVAVVSDGSQCWAWVTSEAWLPFLLWTANPSCSRNSQASTPSRSAWKRRTWTRS